LSGTVLSQTQTRALRHLREILEEPGIKITDAHKKEIDKAIHEIVSVKYKDCSNAWKIVKSRILDGTKSFVADLRQKIKKS